MGLALVPALVVVVAAADLVQPSPRVLLERADEALRAGRTDTAAAVFADVLLDAPGQPWTGYADLGLVLVGLRAGDLDLAATHAERLRASPAHAATAELLVGVIAAAHGETAAASTRLEAFATGSQRQSARATAALGAAYALFWAERYDEAAARFDAVTAQFPGGPLVDDARYGAAWSRWLAGDRERALGDLRALAATRGVERGRVSRALQALEPAAVLSAGITRADTPPLLSSAGQPIAALDVDGAMLALAALRRVDASDQGAETVRNEGPRADDVPAAGAEAGGVGGNLAQDVEAAPAADEPGAPAAPPRPRSRVEAWMVVAALAVMALVVWWLRRGRRSAR